MEVNKMSNTKVGYIAVTPQQKIARHKQFCTGLSNLYATKNHDYGDAFAIARAEQPATFLVHLFEKYNRLATLTKTNDALVSDETVEDTIRDIANYCIMELVERSFEKDARDAAEKQLEEERLAKKKKREADAKLVAAKREAAAMQSRAATSNEKVSTPPETPVAAPTSAPAAAPTPANVKEPPKTPEKPTEPEKKVNTITPPTTFTNAAAPAKTATNNKQPTTFKKKN
jgi:chemotaxis protein histidine kinase CheA